MSFGRGKQQGALQGLRHRLASPDGIKVEHLLFTVGVVEHFRHGIGHDVRAVSALVPRLFRNLGLELPEDDGLGDQSAVPELVIFRVALRPCFPDLLREFGKVLLGTFGNDMGMPCGRLLELGEIRLAEELRLGKLEIELLLLRRRQPPARVDELPA